MADLSFLLLLGKIEMTFGQVGKLPLDSILTFVLVGLTILLKTCYKIIPLLIVYSRGMLGRLRTLDLALNSTLLVIKIFLLVPKQPINNIWLLSLHGTTLMSRVMDGVSIGFIVRKGFFQQDGNKLL